MFVYNPAIKCSNRGSKKRNVLTNQCHQFTFAAHQFSTRPNPMRTTRMPNGHAHSLADRHTHMLAHTIAHMQHVHEPGMPFNFEYAVNDAETANDYNHNAVSDGDVTRGEYRVQLPDGRTQIVKYTADWKNGYNAVVRIQLVALFGYFGSTGAH